MKNITFYGTRGGSSLTSRKFIEFGGATSCVMLNFGETYIMVDCGSGINNAIDDLQDINELHLFVSHSHIDHICGIVNLLPAFEDKKLFVYGKTYNGVSVKESVGRIMNQSLWPVLADDYNNVEFIELQDDFYINDVHITNMDSNHPGGSTIFRFDSADNSIVTAFDFCHLDGFDEKLVNFARGCKVLIYDGNMSPSELANRPDWGHSTPEAGAEIGKQLGVERVFITHFGIYDDDTLNRWESDLQDKYPFVKFARSGLTRDRFQKMVDIGTLLNVERDNDLLLSKIVDASMDIGHADGGTLYLYEDGQLEFKVLKNRSKKTDLIRKGASLGMPPVQLDDKNICAAAAREKKIINIDDCYSSNEYDFSGVIKYDKLNEYHTKTVLAIPLIDENNDLIGVLQLINPIDKDGDITSFNKRDENVIMAIANQIAMAIVKAAYSNQINELLYGFVKVMSVGIDERTPYNANHTKNMIRFADRFLDYQNSIDGKYKVDVKQRREILMGIWLHDTGKVLIPLDIMNKNSRLGDLYQNVVNRFERRDLLLRLALANKQIDNEEYDRLQKQRIDQFSLINQINKAGFLSDDLKSQLDELASQTYHEMYGIDSPVITHEEYYQLSIQKGTLNKEERSVMESHVVMTQKMLAQLSFPKYYDNIPIYAGNHHEFLDGSGYPNHLTAKDLPWPCRLITVCDIFEALIAKDRPYKKPFTVEAAFRILHEMADDGKLDLDIICQFETSKAWIEED